MAVLQKLGGIAVSLLLVRLLSPQIYGQFGLITAFTGFVYVFSLTSFMDHALHVSEEDEEFDPALHWSFGVVLHGALFVLVNLIALGLYWVETYAPVAPYIHITSLGLLLNVPRIYYFTLLRRRLDWRRIRALHATAFLISNAIALSLALLDFGLLALVLHAVMIPLPYCLDLLWTRRDLLAWRLDWQAYRPSFRFGLSRLLGSLFGMGRGLIESAAFVSLTGYAALGLFGRALTLGQLATSFLGLQVTAALYPVLAKLEPGGRRAQRTCSLMLRALTWVSIPAGLVLALAPDAAVRVLYGPKWTEVTPLVLPMVCVALGNLFRQAVGLLALSNVGTRPPVVSEGLVLLGTLPLIALTLSDAGVRAYCTGLALLNVVAIAYLSYGLARRGVFLVRDLLRGFVAAGAGASLGCAWVLFPIPTWLSEHPLALLVALSAYCSLVFVVCLRLIDADGLRDLLVQIPGGSRAAGWLRL